MAKWGEGDPRWIVEERQDSHNVNNWHWKEVGKSIEQSWIHGPKPFGPGPKKSRTRSDVSVHGSLRKLTSDS